MKITQKNENYMDFVTDRSYRKYIFYLTLYSQRQLMKPTLKKWKLLNELGVPEDGIPSSIPLLNSHDINTRNKVYLLLRDMVALLLKMINGVNKNTG